MSVIDITPYVDANTHEALVDAKVMAISWTLIIRRLINDLNEFWASPLNPEALQRIEGHLSACTDEILAQSETLNDAHFKDLLIEIAEREHGIFAESLDEDFFTKQ